MSHPKEIEILIIEDDPNDAELIIRVLRKRHLVNKLVHLKDGAEALEFFFGSDGLNRRDESNNPRVILLDLKLPKVDGLEVLRRIKADEQIKKIPIVVLTSSREERDLKEAYSYGVNSYVTKPIEFEEFSKVVTELGMYWMLLNKSLIQE